ncbi:MAG: hypothetical protein Q4F95_01670 [Oscillospiraceae bacterium]|nr:hypothetical protein [Oscillospiraceae bacterium]
MTDNERNLIRKLIKGSISDDLFIRKISARYSCADEFLEEQLKEASSAHNASDINLLVYVCSKYRLYSEECAAQLCQIMKQKWHRKHSDILHILGTCRYSMSIDCIYETALSSFSYMDYAQSHSIAVECVMILGSMACDKSLEKLKMLSVCSDPLIRYHALKQLSDQK